MQISRRAPVSVISLSELNESPAWIFLKISSSSCEGFRQESSRKKLNLNISQGAAEDRGGQVSGGGDDGAEVREPGQDQEGPRGAEEELREGRRAGQGDQVVPGQGQTGGSGLLVEAAEYRVFF